MTLVANADWTSARWWLSLDDGHWHRVTRAFKSVNWCVDTVCGISAGAPWMFSFGERQRLLWDRPDRDLCPECVLAEKRRKI